MGCICLETFQRYDQYVMKLLKTLILYFSKLQSFVLANWNAHRIFNQWSKKVCFSIQVVFIQTAGISQSRVLTRTRIIYNMGLVERLFIKPASKRKMIRFYAILTTMSYHAYQSTYSAFLCLPRLVSKID